MNSYVLTEKVSAELWYAGERCAFSGGPGTVKPKNENEERALELLLATRPDVCSVAPAASRKKAEEE